MREKGHGIFFWNYFSKNIFSCVSQLKLLASQFSTKKKHRRAGEQTREETIFRAALLLEKIWLQNYQKYSIRIASIIETLKTYVTLILARLVVTKWAHTRKVGSSNFTSAKLIVQIHLVLDIVLTTCQIQLIGSFTHPSFTHYFNK